MRIEHYQPSIPEVCLNIDNFTLECFAIVFASELRKAKQHENAKQRNAKKNACACWNGKGLRWAPLGSISRKCSTSLLSTPYMQRDRVTNWQRKKKKKGPDQRTVYRVSGCLVIPKKSLFRKWEVMFTDNSSGAPGFWKSGADEAVDE